MGDGGDQLGVAALGAAAGLGAPQGDDEPAHGAGGVGTDVARGDEHLAATGEQQVPLGLSAAGGEAPVRVRQRPPAAAFEVLQRQGPVDGGAERLLGRQGGDPGGGRIEADHPAGVVGDDEPVGQAVRVHREAEAVSGGLGGPRGLPGGGDHRAGGAGPGRPPGGPRLRWYAAQPVGGRGRGFEGVQERLLGRVRGSG